MIDPRYRDRVLAVGAFVEDVRAIADASDRPVDQRLHALDRLRVEFPEDPALGARLVQGVGKEISVRRFRNWSELLAWCGFAAAPAGRSIAVIHGEAEPACVALEALHSAMRLLAAVAECATDYRQHDRIYIPADWLRSEGAREDAFAAERTGAELRRALDRTLDGVDRLLTVAQTAPEQVSDRRLRRAVRVCLAEAALWQTRLRRRDPIAHRIVLRRRDRWRARLHSALPVLGRRVPTPAPAQSTR